MEINWITLSAQIVNFLVLAWLLKRFLYGRIVTAMSEREAKIAARLDEAAKQRSEAEAEAKLYRDKNRDLDEQKDHVLAKAKEDAEAHRLELVEKARAEVESTQAKWYEALRQEKKASEQDLRRQLAERVLAALRRILKDLAHAELEQRMMEVFLHHMADLNPADWQAFGEALPESNGEITVRTSHDLPVSLRDRVTKVVREKLGHTVAPRFATAPELVCGIELHVHSQRLTWSVESYLEDLERGFFHALEEKAKEANNSRRQEKDNHGARAATKRTP